MSNTLSGDLFVTGTLTPRRLNVPAGAVTNAAVQAGAGLEASKSQQQYVVTAALSAHADAVAAGRRLLHVPYGAEGAVLSFDALATVAATGDAVATFDLLVNGSSVLTGTFTLDAGDAAGALVAGTVSATALAADDRVEVEVTVSAGSGTLPKGVGVRLVVREDAQ